MMPKRVKRRKDGDEQEGGWEEFYDYVFPDEGEESVSKGAKILEMAHKWKQQAQWLIRMEREM